MKWKTYENFVKITELKEKRKSLEEELSSMESNNGPEERERLLQKVYTKCFMNNG